MTRALPPVLRSLITCAVLLAASGAIRSATAASTCIDVLLKAGGTYRCSAFLDTGVPVEYCLKLRGVSTGGNALVFDSASSVVGSKQAFEQRCTCGAKGRAPKVKFAQDKAYLCLDEATGTVTFGKFSGKKIAGQTYNASVDVRTLFKCVADPACPVCNKDYLPCVVDDDCCAGSGCFNPGPGSGAPFCKDS